VRVVERHGEAFEDFPADQSIVGGR
jgi:hypothetical protein